MEPEREENEGVVDIVRRELGKGERLEAKKEMGFWKKVGRFLLWLSALHDIRPFGSIVAVTAALSTGEQN